MNEVKRFLDTETFFDAAILRHGFTDYMRDYEIIVGGRDGPPHTDVHRYQFVGCVDAIYATAIRPEVFAKSIPDEFVLSGPDYPEKDEPDGFIWGTRWSCAYPGLEYLAPSERAARWSRLLGRPMHEVSIATEAFRLNLVFAEVRHELMGHRPIVHFEKQYPIGTNRSAMRP